MRYLIFFSLFTAISLICHSDLRAESSTPDIFIIKKKESLDTLATKILPRYNIKYGNRIDDLKQDLKEWNPQITTWDDIPIFSKIYTEYPYLVYVPYNYAPKLEIDKNYNILNSDTETPIGDKSFAVYAMYTTSSGNFQEEFKNNAGNIKSSQNSPISLGLGTTYFIDKNNKMLSSSLYWSLLRPSKLSGSAVTSPELEVNTEYGANLYYQQLTPWQELSLYGGLDYEQFPTFNTSAFFSGEDLAFNKNKIIYGTIGIGRTFFWENIKIQLKTAISQSLKSDTTSANPTDKFKGQRLLFFTSIKGDGRFTYHLLFKRHMLEGPTKLTINRIGIGLGFVIF